MAGYKPTNISGNATGLVQERENFLLPNDGYPTLQNAYVWRERIKRKKGCQTLGRLQRQFDDFSLGLSGASPWSFNIYSTLAVPITPEDNAQINPGSVQITIAPAVSTGLLAGYTNAEICEVETVVAHGLSLADRITFTGVNVVVDSGDNLILNSLYRVTSITSPTKFQINANSLSWGIYDSGGQWNKVIGGDQLEDNGDGTLTGPGLTGTIDYTSGDVTITGAAGGQPAIIDFGYFPGLPVMGLRIRELQNSNFYQTVAFDQKYAYIFNSLSWQEFIPGTTWNANNSNITGTNFFWSTNYWISSGNKKIFWATNYSGPAGDPIRYTDGVQWIDFAPQINDAGDVLAQCLCMLPFRGRMVTFNTYEGTDLANSIRYSNRIRWAAIGNPFTTASAIVTTVSADAWRDDIRGKGGFLDIPTSEDIVSVGFVRDNLVIYCQRSTWQLRYTGRSIAPFQIEKVNSENGASSTFSTIQFDTSLVGIGDKGILECDSFKSQLIDVKIPDYVFNIQSANNGPVRIQGARDFINRLAYWTVPIQSQSQVFPDQRLVYNYENDSWALFDDSLTVLGTIQTPTSLRWVDIHTPWIKCNFPWKSPANSEPSIIGGNQQGFVVYLDKLTVNDPTLFIKDITFTTYTVIESPAHNMQTGTVIQITGIPEGSPYSDLNDGVYAIRVLDQDTFFLAEYDAEETLTFSKIVTVSSVDPYIGGGSISIRDNFSIVSKKFNYIEEGQSIQLGYIDILTNATTRDNPGAFSFNVYVDYNDDEATNILPLNNNSVSEGTPDTFFNSIIPTVASNLNSTGGSKFWQRVICPTRGNFITIEYTFSDAQMAGQECELDVQIDSQILWFRRAGRLTGF